MSEFSARVSELLQQLQSLGRGDSGWMGQVLAVVLVVAAVAAAHLLLRPLVIKVLSSVARRSEANWDDILLAKKVFHRVAQLIPALLLNTVLPLLFTEGTGGRLAVERLSLAYLAIVSALVIHSVLSSAVTIYNQEFADARRRPILAYVQVIQIMVWVYAVVLIVAILLGRSPLAMLGGLGAMTAVLLLVFKDSILGLVASIQVEANDMVRVGDWIEIPSFGLDGEIDRISLTTVRVRNWDKSITNFPTYKLITDPFRNWRGMAESGVRRVKRSVRVDVQSIRFAGPDLLAELSDLPYLEDALQRDRVSNLSLFVAYFQGYVRDHPEIADEFTCVVRRKEPTETGMPVELYAFSRQQSMADYEAVQGEIFDHVLAIAPRFRVQIFQRPSGRDFAPPSADEASG